MSDTLTPKQERRTPSVGRPTTYTEELGLSICEEIAKGRPLTRICAEEGMPYVSTVYRWLQANATFCDTYTRAREDQADTLADEIIGISDDGRNDTYLDDEGNVRTDHDVIARSKLRVEARKWVAAKLKPKKYGDFNRTELTGKDGAPLNPDAMTLEQVNARIAELEQRTSQPETPKDSDIGGASEVRTVAQ